MERIDRDITIGKENRNITPSPPRGDRDITRGRVDRDIGIGRVDRKGLR